MSPPEHYHVRTFSGDGTQVTIDDYVYRRKTDAEAALADTRTRAQSASNAPLTPEQWAAETVRACSVAGHIGKDG